VSIRARIFIVVGIVIAAAFAQTLVVLRIENQRARAAAALDRALWRFENQANLGRLVSELDGVGRAYAAGRSPEAREDVERLWGFYERTVEVLPQYIEEAGAKSELASIDAAMRQWHAAVLGASPDSPLMMRRLRGTLDRFETREREFLANRRIQANSQSLQSTLLALAIPALVIVMLLVLVAFTARILLDPLASIAASARQISGGTYNVSLPPESRDEIGDLARAFREMTAAVQRRQREVTEARERAEREHQRLKATIETVPVGLVLVDAETGRIVLRNKAAGLIVGEEPESAADRAAYWGAFRVTNREGAPVRLREWGVDRVMRGEDIVGEELVVTRPGGREIPILVSAAPLQEDDGRITGGVVAFQDITSLYEVDRLKSEFVSTVSHELRTPLTSIKGALQLLLDQGPAADPDDLMLMKVALANTDRLVRIINDILDISKIEAGKLELFPRPHEVAEVVKLPLQNVEPIARGAGVTLVSSIEDGMPRVQVDLDRTIQVLVNLLSNALKVAPPGSEVALDARRQGDGFVALSVTDQGRGIPPEKIGLLFQKFQQLDGANTRRAGGTGLGLAIVKALVEVQGGRVSVKSEVGSGTTFTVTVPVARSVASSQ